MTNIQQITVLALVTGLLGCSGDAPPAADNASADVLLTNAAVYTFSWDEPGPDGTPANNAPRGDEGWRPDAEAVAIRDGKILFAGSSEEAAVYAGDNTSVIDLDGATVLPGLVDSHTHVFGLGARLTQVDLVDVQTEEEAVAMVAEAARSVPKGEWIVGRGWDEGAWANRYPDKVLLSSAVPDHPVLLRSLHGFAAWANQAALDAGGITADTPVPVGRRDASGQRRRTQRAVPEQGHHHDQRCRAGAND